MNAKAMGIKRITVIFTWLMAMIVSLIFILSYPSWASNMKPEGKEVAGGVLKKEIEQQRDLISISLIGVPDYEIIELFNDILENIPGVLKAKRYQFILHPSNPKRCRVDWQVQLENISPFELESRIYHMMQTIGSKNASEDLKLSLIPTPEHRKLLVRIRPHHATSREIRFHFLHLAKNRVNRKPFGDSVDGLWPDRGFE